MKDDPFDYWFKWHPARFKSKTMHLNPYQDGLYRRLIDEYMTTRSALPDNDAALARIAGISLSDFAPHATEIRTFFKPKDSQLFNTTCEEILNAQLNGAQRRKKSAKIAGKASAKKRKEKQQHSNESLNSRSQFVQRKSTRGEEKREEEKKVERDSTLTPPPVYKPPLPPKTPVPSASAGEGGFKKMDGVLGKMGLGSSGSGSATAFNIRDHLTDFELREMLVLCPGWDRNELFRQYNEWIAKKGDIPRSPRAAFMAWLKKKPKNP